MSYHTCLKEATRNGILPNKYRKTIPRSTLLRWKNENPDKYIGTELCQNKHNLQTLLQLVEKYLSLFFAHGRLVKVVLDIVAATLRMDSLNGGPENVNRVVDHFLQQSSMTREIALKDLSFSNSMIEVANKSLKYRYLFPKQVENSEQLKKC